MLTVMSESSTPDGHPVELPIPDRHKAGKALAKALEFLHDSENAIVLALPRGGVPVAKEIASALHVPMDLILVRKVGVPDHEELAMGAIANNGIVIWNEQVLRKISTSSHDIDNAVQKERSELQRREQVYRGGRPAPELENRCVILVDDGLATGATMRAAIDAVRLQQPSRIIVAVPVAPPDTVELLRESADEVICLVTPEPFYGVAEWYLDFPQLTDADVCELLEAAQKEDEGRYGSQPPLPGQ